MVNDLSADDQLIDGNSAIIQQYLNYGQDIQKK